jgi:hypothetical protein
LSRCDFQDVGVILSSTARIFDALGFEGAGSKTRALRGAQELTSDSPFREEIIAGKALVDFWKITI